MPSIAQVPQLPVWVSQKAQVADSSPLTAGQAFAVHEMGSGSPPHPR